MNMKKLVTLLALSATLAVQGSTPAPTDLNAAIAQVSSINNEQGRMNALLNIISNWDPSANPDVEYRIKDASRSLRPQYRQAVNKAIDGRKMGGSTPKGTMVEMPSTPEPTAPPSYNEVVAGMDLGQVQTNAAASAKAARQAALDAQAEQKRATAAVAAVAKAKGDKAPVIALAKEAANQVKQALAAANTAITASNSAKKAMDAPSAQAFADSAAEALVAANTARDAAKAAADQAEALASAQPAQQASQEIAPTKQTPAEAQKAKAQLALKDARALIAAGDEASFKTLLTGAAKTSGSLQSIPAAYKTTRKTVMLDAIKAWSPSNQPKLLGAFRAALNEKNKIFNASDYKTLTDAFLSQGGTLATPK